MNSYEQKRSFPVDVAPGYDRTLTGSSQGKLDPRRWDRVIDLYEAGRYKDAIVAILDYVDPDIAAGTGNPRRTEFIIPHGSVVLRLKIDENNLTVTAPFLNVPTGNKVPFLRQAAQLNLHPLNLSNLILENDQLTFKFSCPTDLCDPYKIYDVFREICIYADSYDDEFIKKFGAQWIQKPIIQNLPLKLIDEAWQTLHRYLGEAFAYIDYFEEKRLFDFCFDIMNITLMKIDYYMSPQGMLRTDLEKAIALLQARDIQLTDKLRKGKEFLNVLKNYDRNEFSKDLYIARTFIPFKILASIENIKANFQGYYDTAKKEIDARDHVGAVLTMLTAFFSLFYHNLFPPAITGVITDALVKSGNKPWHQASATLWTAIDAIMCSERPKKKSRGFFSSLFGK